MLTKAAKRRYTEIEKELRVRNDAGALAWAKSKNDDVIRFGTEGEVRDALAIVETELTDMLEIAEALERAADFMREVAQRPARQCARELRARLGYNDTTVEVEHREDER